MTFLESAYESCGRRAIDIAVGSFRSRYGGDPEDLLSEAQSLFVDAALSWNPAKGDLDKRLYYYIWWGLFETYRTNARHNRILRRVPANLENIAREDRGLNDLLLDPPPIVALALDCRNKNLPDKRQFINETLTDLGWSQAKIAESALEAKEML